MGYVSETKRLGGAYFVTALDTDSSRLMDRTSNLGWTNDSNWALLYGYLYHGIPFFAFLDG
jgi:hypothetical protein